MNASDRQDTQGAPRRIIVRHGALRHAGERRSRRWWDALPVLLIVLAAITAGGVFAVRNGAALAAHLPATLRDMGDDFARHVDRLRAEDAETPDEIAWTADTGEDSALTLEELESAALTPDQREALRRYRECEQEIERRRVALLRENGAKSPYFMRAVEATRAFRAKKADYARLNVKNLTLPERQEWMFEFARLREEAAEANKAHRAWKDAHAGELRRLEDDADYKRLVAEQRACEARLPALTKAQK